MPTQRSFPHPIENGSKSRGDFSPPTTFLRVSKEPRYKGKPSAYLRRPRPVNKGGSSSTLRPTGPHKQKLPLPLLLSRRDLLRRISTAKRTHSVRIRAGKTKH